MANIPIRDIPGAVVASPDPSNLIPMDNGSLMQKTTIANAVNTTLPLSSQAEAEAGVDNAKRMSPLRTKQAIDAQTPAIVNSAITSLNLGTMSQEDASDYTPTSGLAAVALSNDYEDLSNLPTLGTAAAADTGDFAAAAQAVPAGGTTGQVLAKASGTDNDVVWTAAGVGDMLVATYDPTNVAGDAFARANHHGEQGISTIAGLQTTLNDIETTVSQLAIQVADATNVAQFLGPTGSRFADSFDALTHVDVAGATNLDTSVAGVLKPTSPELRVTGATPTAPFGGVAANLNDNNPATVTAAVVNDLSAVSDPNGRIFAKLDLGSVTTITKIEVKQYKFSAGSGTSSGLYYSTDGAVWTLLGEKIAVSTIAVDADRTGPVLARYVALILDAAAFQVTVTVGDLNAYAAPANNLTVRSTSFTAAASPTEMNGLLRVKVVDASVAGTDYTLECSRDGGTTWAAMALTEMYTVAGLLYVEAAKTSVAGQPSGTAPRWRFKTLNNKNVELHDIYLDWTA